MDNLKINNCDPLKIPKGVKIKTLFGFKRFKKETKDVKKEDKFFTDVLFVDEVANENE